MFEKKTIKDLERNYFINGVKFNAIEWGVICRLSENCGSGIECVGNVTKIGSTKGRAAKMYNVPGSITFTITNTISE